MKKHTSSLVRLAAVLSATALIATGCANASSEDGNSDDTSSGFDYSTHMMNVEEPSSDPSEGGTLRVAELAEARSLDPTVTYPTGSTGANVMTAVFDTLMRYDHESESFVPQLAKSLETQDSVNWTLTLREGVKFHDGTPLTADDVVASMERYAESYGLNAVLLKEELKSAKATDDLTVEIELAHKWPGVGYMLANGPGMVLAPAAYKDPKNFKPIGAGPFKFKSYSPNEKTVVTANEDYWNGRPNLDSIEFVVLGADSTGYESLQSGGVDVAYLRSADLVDEAIKDKTPGMVTAMGLTSVFWTNVREGSPGEDKRVRQAIALAVDPEIYLQRLAGGAGNPTKLMIGPDSIWSTGVEPMPADADKAKELLKEAKADGFDGKVRFLARTDQSSKAGALAVQAMLESAGFEVELDLVQNITDQVQKLYVDHDFDIGEAATSITDEALFPRMVSMLGSTSGLNVPGWVSPKWDNLARELQAHDDPAEAKDVLTKMEELWADEAPGVGVSSGAMLNVWNENVHGIVPGAETIIQFDKAWIEQ